MAKRKPGPRARRTTGEPSDAESARASMAAAMERAGIPPAVIYAYRRTGRIVTADSLQCEAEQDLGAWQAAVDEYRARERQATPRERGKP